MCVSSLLRARYDIDNKFFHHNLHGIIIALDYVIRCVKIYTSSSERGDVDINVSIVAKTIVLQISNILKVLENGAPLVMLVDFKKRMHQLIHIIIILDYENL